MLVAAVWAEAVYPVGLRIDFLHFTPYNLIATFQYLILPAISKWVGRTGCVLFVSNYVEFIIGPTATRDANTIAEQRINGA